MGGDSDITSKENAEEVELYQKDIDFAFFFVNFGVSKSEYLELTKREKAFIMKAWEDKQVLDSELLRNAALNAVSNALRKKGAKFTDLWKRKQQPADMKIVQANMIAVEKSIKDEGQSWVDLIYQANNLKKPSGKEVDNG